MTPVVVREDCFMSISWFFFYFFTSLHIFLFLDTSKVPGVISVAGSAVYSLHFTAKECLFSFLEKEINQNKIE